MRIKLTICIFSIVSNLCVAMPEKYQYILEAEIPLMQSPLSIDLDGISFNPDTQQPVLVLQSGNEKYSLPCQLEAGQSPHLWFIPDVTLSPGETVNLELTFQDGKSAAASLTAQADPQAITLKYDNRNILRYYSSLHDVPEGVPASYRRSGFIHPLYSPSGTVLTRIQPPDHYHHYGVWNPWTKTVIEGCEVDFWNLVKEEGTVRFAELLSATSGPVYAAYKVRQEHVILKPAERLAIDEICEVRAFTARIENQPVWIIDFISTQKNCLQSPIELPQYRYGGGLGFRATAQWTKDTCTVLTSEGKTRENADGTRARWCDIRGTTGPANQTSGIVFFSHPSNHQHPEPVRVWPPDAVDGKGDLMFDYCPTRLQDWEFDPDRKYNFKYRMIVYDDKLDPKTINTLWDNYACSTKIKRLK